MNRTEGKLGFDRIRVRLSEFCATDYALQRTEKEEVSASVAEIRHRLQLADEMRLILMFEDNFPTSGYIDASPFLQPLENQGYYLDLLSVGKLKTLLDTTSRIFSFFASVKDGIYPNLKQMVSGRQDYPAISHRIESLVDRFGEMKDSASDELFNIRRTLRSKESQISSKAASILRQAISEGIAEDGASVTIREGKILIPVNTSLKRRLPGIVFDVSSTGKTAFIEPEAIIESENEILELRKAEAREMEKILHEFTEFIRPDVPGLLELGTLIGELDFIMAKARLAQEMAAGMPVISEDGNLNLRKARHPILEKALHKENREIVPLTLSLSPEKRILLISGPNAGGKSVCLKTTGLLQYMFQFGLLIPSSESSELPVFDRIMVSIGDDQSLENDLSTYSSFLLEMKEMLQQADSRSLILIDEFGSGTEPAAGGAIAEAILAEMDRRGVYGVLTTHYTNLKLYASGINAGEKSGVFNGAMLFDTASISPLFKLETGAPGNSFAFELARKTGLPESIVKDAENRAGEDYVDIERTLRRIARNKRNLEERIQKVKRTDKELEALEEEYRKELSDVVSQRKRIIEEARAEAVNIVKGAGSQVERTIREIKQTQADKEKTKAARASLQSFVEAIGAKREKDDYLEKKLRKLEKRGKTPEAPVPVRQEQFKIGEKVRIKSGGLVGEISKAGPRSITVIVGNISSTMSPDNVERISSNEFREASRKVFKPAVKPENEALRQRKLSFSPEIDLRGERVADALSLTVQYIDDAIMLGMHSVRIIHGKGTGALREEIQKYLRTVPGVSVRDEDIRQGGTGVTIVDIN